MFLYKLANKSAIKQLKHFKSVIFIKKNYDMKQYYFVNVFVTDSKTFL